MATWAVFALLAAFRRSRPLAMAAGLYGMLIVFSFAATDTSNMEETTGLLDGLAFGAFMLASLGGAVHGAIVLVWSRLQRP